MYLKDLLILFFVCNVHCSTVKDLKKDFYDLSNAEELFDDFVKNFDKEYENEQEYEIRFKIFKKNLEMINDLNNQSDSAIFGITQLLDLTEEEFIDKYTGLLVSPDEAIEVNDTDILREGIPESYDWRNYNVVTEIKNQGGCGSCWAFAAVGCIEGQYAIKYKSLVSLSEQELLDCSQAGTCNRGYTDKAMQGAARMGGLMTEQEYRYSGSVGTCKFQPNRPLVRVTDGRKIMVRSEDELRRIVFNYGPITVGIQALAPFQAYRGNGVATSQWLRCVPNGLTNHSVLLVGFENENGVPYWILKNSYGLNWGEQGYMRLQSGNNPCSILDNVVQAYVS